MNEPSCSIVIRCYNEERHIGRLLEGILNQTQRDVEMIVVDSGSTDRTLEIVRRFPVRLLEIAKADFSFGRALNLGCRAARGGLIVIASAHVYPLYTDWLTRLLAPFENPKIALSYGRQCGAPVTRFSEHQVFAHWFGALSQPEQDQPFCNNANAAIRRELFERFPYDESLTGLEDLDWGKRALAAGFKLAYVAEAPVVHVHEERPAQIFNRYKREALALKRILPQQHFGFWDFLSCWSGNIWSDLREARRQGRLREVWREVIAFRSLQFWGTYRGFSRRRPLSDELLQRFYYPKTGESGAAAPLEAQEPVAYREGERGGTPVA